MNPQQKLLASLRLDKYEILIYYREISRNQRNEPTVNDILNAVVTETGIPFSQIKSKTRLSEVCRARMVICLLLTRIVGLGTVKIGKMLKRNSSTISYALQSARKLSETNKSFANLVAGIQNSFLDCSLQSMQGKAENCSGFGSSEKMGAIVYEAGCLQPLCRSGEKAMESISGPGPIPSND